MTFACVLDCRDPERLAEFWGEALGYREADRDGRYVLLVPRAGRGPDFVLQCVPEMKTGKNRMHLDIRTDRLDEEAERLSALGARRLRPDVLEEAGDRWIVMADPEGNEFCVCAEAT
ncbi:MAG: VOC family protein [Trebonia sp.]